jgi:cbb3-type cytochrome oxidase maturation protein
MSVIVLLIVAGGSVAAGFLGAFVWAVRSGQFDDTCTPAIRILFEDGGRALMAVGLPPEGGRHGTNEYLPPEGAIEYSRGFRLQAEENPGDNEVEMSAESGWFV